MKKKLIIIFSILSIISCSDSDEKELNEVLTGSFTEVSPIKERVNLEFLSKTELRQKIVDYDIVPTYSIRLLNNDELELSCNECDEIDSQIVSYRVIDNDTFEIGGFFPADNNDIMIFERD